MTRHGGSYDLRRGARRLVARMDLLRLAGLAIAGHWVWLLILLPLLWLAARALMAAISPTGGFDPVDAQVGLMGIPLAALGIILGLRIIAGEMDGRSLEIAYTVPGGCERVWWSKLAAGALILLIAALLVGAVTYYWFTDYPLITLYGALQGAVFYLVMSMALATLFRSEVAGAMATVAVLAVDLLILGGQGVRASPFWNPLAVTDPDPEVIFAMTVQNRVGVPIFIALVIGLAFMRANRRERMLGG
ncbi:MAG: hypothetical protein F4X98_12200 [Gammaproteobacteria bacterium]|nr:hypothetical protein [Gammaproteobacteria bacterium]